MANDQVVLITGGSRGFGAAAARLIAQRGNTVIATMRNPDRDGPDVVQEFEDRIHPVQLDVTDSENVNRVVHDVLQRFGRIDVLINNAGYGLHGPTEDVSEEEVRRQFDTNFVGQWRLIKAVLPSMRERGRGKIANVSSTAGRLAGPIGGMYSASKHAVEAMSEALRYELIHTGVQVTIFEPGMFRSDWQTTNLDVCETVRNGTSAYAPAIEKSLESFRALAITRPASTSVAAAMADFVHLEQPVPQRWPVGNDSTHQMTLRPWSTDEEWALVAAAASGYGLRGNFLAELGPAELPDWTWGSDNIVIVTGASRGFGEAAAREIAMRGNTVIATMRNPDRDAPKVVAGLEDRIIPVQLDVQNREQVQQVVAETIARHGRVDALVNNAGYGLYGPVEDCSEEEIWRQIDTNFCGQWRMAKAVLPHMREHLHGKVINVSSISGQVSSPLMGFYAASKHAIEAMTEAIAGEGAPFGVQATIVQPGMYASDWQTNNLDVCQAVRDGKSPYQAGVERALTAFRERAATRPGSDAVGAALADAVELQQKLPMRWPIGDDAVRMIRLRRITPDDQWEERMIANGWGFRPDEVKTGAAAAG